MSLLDRREMMFRYQSPYSPAASAALMSQFNTEQMSTIILYGVAHPEIVPYMNAYAPEDAKIAYSLVDGLGIRAIKSDGSGYLDTGFAEQHLFGIEFGMRVDGNVASWNSYVAGTLDNFTIGSSYSSTTTAYVRTRTTQILSNAPTSNSIFYDYQLLHGYLTINGEQKATISETPLSSAYTKNIVFANNGAYNRPSKVSFTYGKLYGTVNETLEKWFVPFERNGNMEFLDVISGNIATRSGNFTEVL